MRKKVSATGTSMMMRNAMRMRVLSFMGPPENLSFGHGRAMRYSKYNTKGGGIILNYL